MRVEALDGLMVNPAAGRGPRRWEGPRVGRDERRGRAAYQRPGRRTDRQRRGAARPPAPLKPSARGSAPSCPRSPRPSCLRMTRPAPPASWSPTSRPSTGWWSTAPAGRGPRRWEGPWVGRGERRGRAAYQRPGRRAGRHHRGPRRVGGQPAPRVEALDAGKAPGLVEASAAAELWTTLDFRRDTVVP